MPAPDLHDIAALQTARDLIGALARRVLEDDPNRITITSFQITWGTGTEVVLRADFDPPWPTETGGAA